VQQAIKANRYRGLRVRWSAFLGTQDVSSVWGNRNKTPAETASSPGAGLYVVIDSREATVLYTMTRDRLLGTNDWTRVEMIFDVPAQSVLITIGFFLAGEGKAWAGGFALERVGPTIEKTPDLDLTDTQIYDYTFARHKKRLKEYKRSPDVPVLRITAAATDKR